MCGRFGVSDSEDEGSEGVECSRVSNTDSYVNCVNNEVMCLLVFWSILEIAKYL